MSILTATSVILAAIIGGTIGWAGNYYVQGYLLRQHRRIDELRRSFYAFLELIATYWVGSDVGAERCHLEAKMIALQQVIMSEYQNLASSCKNIKKSYDATSDDRTQLWDAATGGCFQQKDWNPNPDRVKLAAKLVTDIAKTLP